VKNQNDLIVLIVAFVVLVGGTLTCFFMKPQPTKPTAPAEVDVTAPQLPSQSVVFVNGLSGGGSGSGRSLPGMGGGKLGALGNRSMGGSMGMPPGFGGGGMPGMPGAVGGGRAMPGGPASIGGGGSGPVAGGRPGAAPAGN
jgi:preprotein translocase subunit SecD